MTIFLSMNNLIYPTYNQAKQLVCNKIQHNCHLFDVAVSCASFNPKVKNIKLIVPYIPNTFTAQCLLAAHQRNCAIQIFLESGHSKNKRSYEFENKLKKNHIPLINFCNKNFIDPQKALLFSDDKKTKLISILPNNLYLLSSQKEDIQTYQALQTPKGITVENPTTQLNETRILKWIYEIK